MAAGTSDERRENRGRSARGINWRENWYRDLWLFVLSVLVLVSIASAYQWNKDRIGDIQSSRLQVCEMANARHDKAVAVTTRLLARPVRDIQLTPAQRAQQRRQVVEWVNSLVPTQDCKSLVEPPTANPKP